MEPMPTTASTSGDLLNDLLLVALSQAAGHNDLEVRIFLLVLAGHQDILDSFGFGGLDEAAGVDDDNVSLGGVSHGGVAVLDEAWQNTSASTWFFGQPREIMAIFIG